MKHKEVQGLENKAGSLTCILANAPHRWLSQDRTHAADSYKSCNGELPWPNRSVAGTLRGSWYSIWYSSSESAPNHLATAGAFGEG
jgi:hypothetical protein